MLGVAQQVGNGEQPGLAHGSALGEEPFFISLSPQTIELSKVVFICKEQKSIAVITLAGFPLSRLLFLLSSRCLGTQDLLYLMGIFRQGHGADCTREEGHKHVLSSCFDKLHLDRWSRIILYRHIQF